MFRLRRDRLAPRLRDQLAAALRPGWSRSMLVRRSVAVLLAVAAVAAAVAAQTGGTDRMVLVAAHDLTPGRALEAADVVVASVPAELAPDGSLTEVSGVLGRLSVGVVGAGEILTESRLLSTQLPAALTGRDDARLVPVPVADAAVAGLLRQGDVVDVVTEEGTVLARGAVVAVAAAEQDGGGTLGAASTPPALLAMNEAAAHRVAASSLTAALAVVLH